MLKTKGSEREQNMKFYCEDIERAIVETSSSYEGLSSEEAAKRLEKNGKNKLAEAKKASLLSRFLHELTDPMIIILLAAAAISGVLAVVEGESFADVIIILAVVIINAVLGVQNNAALFPVLWGLNGFCQSTVWANGLGVLNKWWPKKERGFYHQRSANSLSATSL